MDVGQPALRHQLLRLLIRFVPDRAVQDDFGAVPTCGGDLGGRRILGHAHNRVHAVQLRGKGHALRVVSGGRTDDAAALLLGGEIRELVQRTAYLVGPRFLEDLGLETHVEAGALAEDPRGQDRRLVDLRGDDGARALEVGTCERGEGHHAAPRARSRSSAPAGRRSFRVRTTRRIW